MIKVTQFKNLFPYAKNPEEWVDMLNKELTEYGITSNIEIAAFLAQTGHESMGYTRFSENLNYSAKALMNVFSKYFTYAEAHKYERQPEKIANRVYANRLGNGNEESRDGWRYRGRGLIQITGKYNYEKFFEAYGLNISPDEVATNKKYIILSAIWYWQSNNLGKYANDIKTLTRKINGGYNGLEDRKRLFEKAKQEMQE